MKIVYVNQHIEKPFILKKSKTLDRVISDVLSCSEHVPQNDGNENVTLTSLQCVKAILTDWLLEKLPYSINLHR